MSYGLQEKIFKVSVASASFFFSNPILGKSSKDVSVTMLDAFQQIGEKPIPTKILHMISCHTKRAVFKLLI